MNIFIDLHVQLIKKLLEEKVDFIIIGGYLSFIMVIKEQLATLTFGLNLIMKTNSN